MSKMIKCKGCDEKISKKAKICPKCGEPTPKKTSLLTWLVGILLITGMVNYANNTSSNSSAKTCYNQDVLELFKKAYKKQGISVERLFWKSKQTDREDGTHSNIMNFDSRENRGLISYDKHCNPEMIKISSGYGEVTMYYYEVKDNNLKLIKTRKNTYRK